MTARTLPLGRALGLLLVVGLGVTGCDHLTEPDGPRLIDRFGDFAVLDPLAVDRVSVDFAAGESVTFTGRFNKQVNWVVEITGQESGAVKRLEGFSATLDAMNAQWRGGTTELPLFKDEPVEAALFVPEEMSDTTRVMIEVVTPRTYPGEVAADFEGSDDITVGNFEFEFEGAGISAEVPPAQGDGFYLFRGTDDVLTNFFVGLIDIRPRDDASFFTVPTAVPEDLYLNFFLYSFGTPNTIAVVQVITDGNGSGGFEDGQDTVYPAYDAPVDGVGWQAIGVRLSDIGITSSTEAAEIVALRVLLISDENNQPNPPVQVDFGIDYLTFTAGGPLEL